MMSESSFRITATAQTRNNSDKAIGLMQITEYTFSLLGEDQKESFIKYKKQYQKGK